MTKQRTTFHEYVGLRFRADLEALVAGGKDRAAAACDDPSTCPHHGVPADRVVELPVDRSRFPAEFWAAWYVTTLLHQAVHRYAPRSEDAWLARYGRHPLAMQRQGFGWRPVLPRELLRGVADLRSIWQAVCDNVTQVGVPALHAVGIDPATLVTRILADTEFDQEHPLEGEVGRKLQAAVAARG